MLEPSSDGVFFLWLPGDADNAENRLTVPFMHRISEAVSEAQRRGARALVTVSRNRFWSNGVDLNARATDDILAALQRLCAVFMEAPFPTVALINGHAFGGGLMLALAHDYRVAYPAKGWLCIPAVDLRIVLPRPLVLLARAKLGRPVASRVLLSGDRFGGIEAAQLGIVEKTVKDFNSGVDFARGRARDVGIAYGATKAMLFDDVIAELNGKPRAKL